MTVKTSFLSACVMFVSLTAWGHEEAIQIFFDGNENSCQIRIVHMMPQDRQEVGMLRLQIRQQTNLLNRVLVFPGYVYSSVSTGQFIGQAVTINGLPEFREITSISWDLEIGLPRISIQPGARLTFVRKGKTWTQVSPDSDYREIVFHLGLLMDIAATGQFWLAEENRFTFEEWWKKFGDIDIELVNYSIETQLIHALWLMSVRKNEIDFAHLEKIGSADYVNFMRSVSLVNSGENRAAIELLFETGKESKDAHLSWICYLHIIRILYHQLIEDQGQNNFREFCEDLPFGLLEIATHLQVHWPHAENLAGFFPIMGTLAMALHDYELSAIFHHLHIATHHPKSQYSWTAVLHISRLYQLGGNNEKALSILQNIYGVKRIPKILEQHDALMKAIRDKPGNE